MSSSGKVAAAAVRAGARPLRLAMFSPVAPIRSGISAYLADLLPLLPEAWDIDVFTDAGIEPEPQGLARAAAPAPCFPHSEFRRRHADEPYDLTVYQVGNSTARTYMLDYVIEHPGLLVLRDGVVHPARIEAATAAGAMLEYRQIAESCRGDIGRAVGHLVAGGLGGPAIYSAFPMCEDLVDASLVTAMHGELACAWLRGLVPSACVVPLAHWRSVDITDDLRAAWRHRLGAPDDVVIGSFGNIGSERRLDRAFHALADIDEGRPWRLVVAGSVDQRLGLETLAAELGIGDRIDWHEGLSDADFVAVMGAVDLAINLRYPPARSSSGVLHQLLQLGVPTLISDVVHWREYPEAAVARIPPGPDEAEDKALRAALARWIVNPEARAAAARVGREWAAHHISPQRMRETYVEAVAAALDAADDGRQESSRL